MAYIDKITTMRRMALIYEGYGRHDGSSNGAIAWEGVNIEGDVVLKEVCSDKITTIKEANVADFSRKRGLEAVYQDPEGEDYWEPREAL